VIFIDSPMPTQMISNGTRARCGSIRAICTGGSMASSPIRTSPAIAPRIRARTPPMASPAAARVSESTRCEPRVPSALSRQPVLSTVLGAGSFCSGSTPERDSASQISRIAAGLTIRCQRNRRRVRSAGAAVSTTGGVATAVIAAPR
jgi:hypothetical protein